MILSYKLQTKFKYFNLTFEHGFKRRNYFNLSLDAVTHAFFRAVVVIFSSQNEQVFFLSYHNWLLIGHTEKHFSYNFSKYLIFGKNGITIFDLSSSIVLGLLMNISPFTMVTWLLLLAFSKNKYGHSFGTRC